MAVEPVEPVRVIEIARDVIAAWPLAAPIDVAPLPGGLINHTFLVTAGDARHVLQRLHPIFGAEVNLDIEAITRHLDARGVTTPRLVATTDGALFVTRPDGVWRLQTFIAGYTVHAVRGPAMAQAAGTLVARFHAALADLAHSFHFRRAFVHDTAHHRSTLEAALREQTGHALYGEAAPLADELFAALSALPRWDAIALPVRIAHGDLKISNVLFVDELGSEARCLVDLDTVAPMRLPYELGDAWRSWCNPAGEDTGASRFDLDLLAAAWAGYGPGAASFITPEERELLVAGVLTITVELAMRFLADALFERYFGWDATRFASRGAHNLIRAQGQAQLYRSLAAQRAAAEQLIRS